MGFRETCAVEERMRFVMAAEAREEPFAALCRQFGVSRRVGYKWLGRYREDGVEGLQELWLAYVEVALCRDAESGEFAVPVEVGGEGLQLGEGHGVVLDLGVAEFDAAEAGLGEGGLDLHDGCGCGGGINFG